MERRFVAHAFPAAGLMGLALLMACADTNSSTAVESPPAVQTLLTALTCQADVRRGAVECTPDVGAANQLSFGTPQLQRLLGGQGTYVRIASFGVDYSTDVFGFWVTVQNLVTETMATHDGITRDDRGVRIVIHQGPTVTSGSGSITIRNANGTGTFTGGGQPYFQYGGKINGFDQADLGADGLLASGEISTARFWEFDVPASVTSFSLGVFVATEMPPGQLVTIAPQVTSVAPATLVPGNSATISGFNFRPLAVDNAVTIGGVYATVTAASATELQVTVPCTTAGVVPVQVTTSSGRGNAVAHPTAGC